MYKAIGAGLAVFLLIVAVGFGLDWFSTGKDIVSPDNVTNQYRGIIGNYEGLEAAAANACAAKNNKSEEADPTLVEDPSFAYAANYRKIAIEYNRRWANVFEAKVVGPQGYPKKAPTLKEMQRKVC